MQEADNIDNNDAGGESASNRLLDSRFSDEARSKATQAIRHLAALYFLVPKGNPLEAICRRAADKICEHLRSEI